jgi:hypothetical protein
LLEELDGAYGHLNDDTWQMLESLWQDRIGLLNQAVVVETTAGHTNCGRLRELTFAGLVLEQAGGAELRLPPEAVRQLLRG